ncbi:MAG: shikimate dehydrogenase [Clostridiales bacterium]|nr:shikimate dehydrogenase [Clostridiales bacterium]
MEYGLIAKRLGHSFSKDIHNKIDNYNYEPTELDEKAFADFMSKKDFKGINVTIPYKCDVIPYLYKTDKAAEKIGAVNTIVNKNGKLYGYNTDFGGMTALIKRLGLNLQNSKVLILGTGGTSKTAYCVAESLSAREIIKVSRKKSDESVTYEQAIKNHCDADYIINTTPCGMYPNCFDMPIDLSAFKKLSGVVDAVFNPLSTMLVAKAKELGIKAAGGLYMLVAQAVLAARIFTGKNYDDMLIDKIYTEIFSEKRNLVFYGVNDSIKTELLRVFCGKFDMDCIQIGYAHTSEQLMNAAIKNHTLILCEGKELSKQEELYFSLNGVIYNASDISSCDTNILDKIYLSLQKDEQ